MKKAKGRTPAPRRKLRGGHDPLIGKATQFKPGQSGNPSGKPGYDVAAFIARRIFEEHGLTISKAMARKLSKGDVKAFAVLADRGYGKVPQHIEHAGADGEPLSITIKFAE